MTCEMGCNDADDDLCCWCSDVLANAALGVDEYGHKFCSVGCLIEWQESA